MNGTVNTPVIPEYITVHLGRPAEEAANVTVPFVDYIKNVASSEIYPTWPDSALRANIYAQITFALNRIYTEYYRSRGYDFDITNSTTVDQAFVYERNIFENVAEIVDELFNDYVVRQGSVEPLFTQYCNGTTVTCDGLLQWGTVALAEQGLTPYQILQNYYGEDIDIRMNAPVEGVTESVPDRLLREGIAGNDVKSIQVRLNRISSNFPLIPKISPVDGIFGPETTEAVREFQRTFNLTVDGVVGRSTWYAIQRIYNAVKRVSELDSEGIPLEDVTDLFATVLKEGDVSVYVRELQYLLSYVGAFEQELPVIAVDGIFGPETRSAVVAAQRLYGLPQTGEVNIATWDAIYRAYRSIRDTVPLTYTPGTTAPYPGYPLRINSEGDAVTLLQEYLNYIGRTYTSIPRLEVDGKFGPSTQAAVREFQRLFGIDQSGVVAAFTWNEIAAVYRDLYEGNTVRPGQFPGVIIGL